MIVKRFVEAFLAARAPVDFQNGSCTVMIRLVFTDNYCFRNRRSTNATLLEGNWQ